MCLTNRPRRERELDRRSVFTESSLNMTVEIRRERASTRHVPRPGLNAAVDAPLSLTRQTTRQPWVATEIKISPRPDDEP
jgi:hypothetical protein